MVDDDARDALEGILLEDVECFSCVTHQEFEVRSFFFSLSLYD